MASEKALAIMADFQKYLKTGEVALVERYTKTEITMALSEVSASDSNHAWYKAMERRVEQVDRLEEKKKESVERKNEKWLDRGIGFVLGIIGTLTATYLLRLLKF